MDTDHDMRVTTVELMAVFNATQKVNKLLETKTKGEFILSDPGEEEDGQFDIQEPHREIW